MHTGGRRYLVVVPGNLSCVRGGSDQLFVRKLEEGAVFKLGREDVCSNAKMLITAGGRHVSQYVVKIIIKQQCNLTYRCMNNGKL